MRPDVRIRPHPSRRARRARSLGDDGIEPGPTGKSGHRFAPMSRCEWPLRAQTACAKKANFVRRFNGESVVQPACQKYSSLRKSEYVPMLRGPALARGALRDRHERWERDAMDVSAAPDERCRYGR